MADSKEPDRREQANSRISNLIDGATGVVSEIAREVEAPRDGVLFPRNEPGPGCMIRE